VSELPKALSAFSDRGGEGAIKFAVKKELPVLGIEADDVGRQHIDREIRRELRNVVAGAPRRTCPAITRHDVRALPWFAGARRILRPLQPPRPARTGVFLDQDEHPPALKASPLMRKTKRCSNNTWFGRVDFVEPGQKQLYLSVIGSGLV
jgi:hypothetical protein